MSGSNRPRGFDPYAPPAQWGPSPYPGGQHAYGHSPQASARAVWAMVLSALGWIACGCLTSLPGVILARSEISAIDRGESSPGGRGLATAAFWIGAINLAIYAIALGVVALMLLFSPSEFQ